MPYDKAWCLGVKFFLILKFSVTEVFKKCVCKLQLFTTSAIILILGNKYNLRLSVRRIVGTGETDAW